MTDFRRSAALMAESLRTMKKLQNYHREVGDSEVMLPVADLFSSKDQAALDAYEAECLEHSGAVPLGLEIPA